MPRPVTPRRILNALDKLGPTPSTVAKSLKALKLEAGRYTYDCPIAAYLKKTFSTDDVSASQDEVSVNDTRVEISNKHPVSRFIDAFDSGMYQSLNTLGR